MPSMLYAASEELLQVRASNMPLIWLNVKVVYSGKVLKFTYSVVTPDDDIIRSGKLAG